MSQVPQAVQVAASVRSSRRREPVGTGASRGDRAMVRRGDVRTVSGEGGSAPRLCVVIKADPHGEFADVVLAHSFSELATGADAVVSRVCTDLPYELVVETDLRGVVWTYQLGRRIGSLPADVFARVALIARGDVLEVPHFVGVRTGPPLGGPDDRRWAFKEDEGAAFRGLTMSCSEVLLDSGSPWELDPGLADPDAMSEADDPAAVLDELSNWLQTRRSRRLVVTADVLDQMLEHTDGAGGATDLSDLGLDVQTLLWSAVAEIATEGIDTRGSTAPRRVVSVRNLASAPDSLHAEVHYLGDRRRVLA